MAETRRSARDRSSKRKGAGEQLSSPSPSLGPKPGRDGRRSPRRVDRHGDARHAGVAGRRQRDHRVIRIGRRSRRLAGLAESSLPHRLLVRALLRTAGLAASRRRRRPGASGISGLVRFRGDAWHPGHSGTRAFGGTPAPPGLRGHQVRTAPPVRRVRPGGPAQEGRRAYLVLRVRSGRRDHKATPGRPARMAPRATRGSRAPKAAPAFRGARGSRARTGCRVRRASRVRRVSRARPVPRAGPVPRARRATPARKEVGQPGRHGGPRKPG